jgi:phosphonate transport system permease protein
MTAPVNPALLTPPIKPLGQRAFDFVLWGGIVVLLIISFGPAELTKFPLLFSNSCGPTSRTGRAWSARCG